MFQTNKNFIARKIVFNGIICKFNWLLNTKWWWCDISYAEPHFFRTNFVFSISKFKCTKFIVSVHLFFSEIRHTNMKRNANSWMQNTNWNDLTNVMLLSCVGDWTSSNLYHISFLFHGFISIHFYFQANKLLLSLKEVIFICKAKVDLCWIRVQTEWICNCWTSEEFFIRRKSNLKDEFRAKGRLLYRPYIFARMVNANTPLNYYTSEGLVVNGPFGSTFE